jgi:hypothetical protein
MNYIFPFSVSITSGGSSVDHLAKYRFDQTSSVYIIWDGFLTWFSFKSNFTSKIKFWFWNYKWANKSSWNGMKKSKLPLFNYIWISLEIQVKPTFGINHFDSNLQLTVSWVFEFTKAIFFFTYNVLHVLRWLKFSVQFSALTNPDAKR